ncbi:MAG: CDP-alcohol phosphatidyltransferase family protein [Tissierellales bacterium]|jgi:cardiolipin synthase|nr:CDP-alcohol phosphatidyltransferase family protein [Tissierellales bacterium]
MKYIPNILTTLRLVLVPIFISVYFSSSANNHLLALFIYIIASFTDFLDGFIARKYSVVSKLGSVLDPLADKLMLLAVLFAFYLDNKIPLFILVLMLVKESILVLSATIMYLKKEPLVIPSNIFGKTATIVFTLSIILVFILPEYKIGYIFMFIAILLKFTAFFSYFKITLSHILKHNN